MLWKKNNRSGTALIAKDRLTNTLASERGQNVKYLDDLKTDIREIVSKYTRASNIIINAHVNKNNKVDIKVYIGD